MFGLLKTLLVFWILLNSLPLYGESPTPGVTTDKPNQQNANPKKQSKTDESVAEQKPVVVTVSPSQTSEPPTAPPTKQEKQESTDWDWWADKSPEIILAIATIALWLATRRLVIGADKTAGHQLRAYIGADRPTLEEGTHYPVRWKIMIRNYGPTMAKDVRVWIDASIKTRVPHKWPSGDLKCRAVIMPGEFCGFTENVNGTSDDVSNLQQVAAKIYLWGRIEYTDVFKKLHWTTFRFESDGRLPEGNGWKAIYSQEGNDAD